MTIWNQLRNLFGRSKRPVNEFGSTNHHAGGLAVSPVHVVDLMHRLERTLDNAYSCEEAFALLDEYVELVASTEEARKLMPLVQNHLDMCPDCRDEFEMLLHILQTADSEED